MPLFKICSSNRKIRIIIKAVDLENLMQLALQKFNVESAHPRIVLESDGMEIDNTEVLLEVIGDKSMDYTFLLLLDDETWSIDSEGQGMFSQQVQYPILGMSSPSTSGSSLPQRLSSRTSSPLLDCPSPKSSVSSLLGNSSFAIPWASFPKKLLEACAQKKLPTPGDRREMVRIIADALVNEYGDCSRGTCVSVARQICDKYPESFVERSGLELIGPGYDILRSQIYGRVNHLNRNKPVNCNSGLENNLNIPNVSPQVKRTLDKDAYGCVAYFPGDLPDGETVQSQEACRLEMLNLSEATTEDFKKTVERMMEKTYVSQRMTLLNYDNDKKTIAELQKCWPHLCTKTGLLNHSNILMGFNTTERWNRNITEKGETVYSFMKSVKGKAMERMATQLANTNLCAEQHDSKLPFMTSIVPLLIRYFNEEPFYIVVPDSILDHDAIQKVDTVLPTLVIKGRSIHDCSGCILLIENIIVALVRTPLQGFLLLFLSYFIFNISYPESAASTLEFIQRYILSINPPTGTKRRGKPKKTIVAPKVASLMRALGQN